MIWRETQVTVARQLVPARTIHEVSARMAGLADVSTGTLGRRRFMHHGYFEYYRWTGYGFLEKGLA
jgi:hypothetical protein